MKKISAFEAFAQSQITYTEAEEKAKLEAGSPKVARYRIGEDGEYTIRILPLAPTFDEDGNILPMERKGYDYPVHQQFITIEIPAKGGGKKKKMSIPVIRTTDTEVGYSVDIIDTYVKIAKEMYGDDKELMELIDNSNYYGGLRWSYQHAIMVLDLLNDKERAKGPQLWQCSHSQYRDLDGAKMRLWRELRADGEQDTCPISWFTGAYPVKVVRTTEKKKTSYNFEIGRKTVNVKEEEAQALLDMPRIPEQIYRYTRYQFEATVEFLKQYDEKHEMEVCKEADFIEAVEKLKGELPKDDNSHFDLASASQKSETEEVSINSLWAEFDNIVDQELGEKSDEYQELREKIRQFIEDQELDVRISRTKNNQQLLEEIEDALDEKERQPKKEAKKEQKEEAPAKTTRTARTARPKADDDEPTDEGTDDNGREPEPEPETEPEPEAEPEPENEVPARRRRPRPDDEEENGGDDNNGDSDKEEKPSEEEGGQQRRRLHSRRLR